MEDLKAHSLSNEMINIGNLPVHRPLHEPDVPQDIDYVQQHLNDPYLDLRAYRPPSERSFTMRKKRNSYEQSEVESQFDRYSTSRAESRNSTAIEFDDESPYPEVRAAVSSIDDPSMPVNTFRMWFIGLFFVLFGTSLNMIFSLRFPSIYLSGIVVQLLSLPMGMALARILPTTRFRTLGYVWSFNPGPFNIKEHVCITVMANVSIPGVYASDVLLSQEVFYGQTLPYSYQILLSLSTQIFGFAFGGLLRQFVVWPSSMIWPGALVNSTLFHALHKNYGVREQGHISRNRFFCIAAACSFVWYWVPGYLFTALSAFNWICWIVPNNVVVNVLFGTSTGLGMSVLTFDWSMISFIGSPLVTPWWSEMNTGAGFILFFWIVTPILYFTNAFNTAHFPISSRILFDNTGNPFDPKAVVTGSLFDPAKYSAYSPAFLSTTLVLATGLAFAVFPAVFVHTYLWFGKDITRRFKNTLKDERDIHSRLMQAYKEVPWYWYAAVGVICFAFLCVAVEIFPTQMPIWAVVIAIMLACAVAIPLAMLQAITNQSMPIQVMHEFVGGYMLPNRPIANSIFKTIAFIGSYQAVTFAGDLKLGHYMKIPPRTMFNIQLIGTILSAFIVVTIQNWMLHNIEDICTPAQRSGYICPSTTTFATATMFWGGIGPRRNFGPDGPYRPLLWFFLVGALAPVPFYFLARRMPLSFWRFVNMPVFFGSLSAIPPASGLNYVSWVFVGFMFNFVIRRFHLRWWMRYNYILSAALDSGLAVALIVIFLATAVPKGGVFLNWWGNTVWLNTADANGIPIQPIPSGTTIGPSSW